ncbi:MAG: tetratricopeptide (TPR) repeat protein [Myxococcota bacterium]|jgi:tetratricopeptide (TPR) repeat protein
MSARDPNPDYERAVELTQAEDDYDAANLAYRAAARAQPGGARVHANHSVALHELGHRHAAQEAAERATALAPGDAYVWWRGSWLALRHDRYDHAGCSSPCIVKNNGCSTTTRGGGRFSAAECGTWGVPG